MTRPSLVAMILALGVLAGGPCIGAQHALAGGGAGNPDMDHGPSSPETGQDESEALEGGDEGDPRAGRHDGENEPPSETCPFGDEPLGLIV